MVALPTGCCTRNLPANVALRGLIVIIALTFAGLFGSMDAMWAFSSSPTCVDGTSSTFPPPSGGPPYCSKDALSASAFSFWYSIGYFGSYQFIYNDFLSRSSMISQRFCLRTNNGTCPSLGSLGLTKITILTVMANSAFVPKADEFMTALGSVFAANFNNVPVTFSGTLPSGLTEGTKYFLRAGTTGFQVSLSIDGNPYTSVATTTQTFTMQISSFDSCPSQIGRGIPAISASSTNPDKSLKEGSCGYCLSEPQRIAVLAVPGLIGITLALLLLAGILFHIPVVYQKPFFRWYYIVTCIFCIIFLVACLASSAVIFAQITACARGFSLDGSLSSQFAPSPTGAPLIGSYKPVSGGSGTVSAVDGSFSCSTDACYNSPTFIPSSGAIWLIISVIVLFIHVIFVAIRVDFSGQGSNSDSAMIPR